MKIGPEGQKNDKMDTFPGEKVLFITGFAQLIFWFKSKDEHKFHYCEYKNFILTDIYSKYISP